MDTEKIEEIRQRALRWDADLREAAKSSPELAKVLQECDEHWERETGKPWVNPLIKEEEG